MYELVLRAVGEIQEVGHGDEGVVERLDGGDPLVGVDGQHLGQQVDELPAVGLLRQHVAALQVRRHVHLEAAGRQSSKTRKQTSPTAQFPSAGPINTHKASSVEGVCVCLCHTAPVITLHLSDIINICTGIYSTAWNISRRLR